MTGPVVGRVATLDAQRALEHQLKSAEDIPLPEAIAWAAEQLRYQTVVHIRTLGPSANRSFLARMTAAIKALEASVPRGASSEKTP